MGCCFSSESYERNPPRQEFDPKNNEPPAVQEDIFVPQTTIKLGSIITAGRNIPGGYAEGDDGKYYEVLDI